jgi:hypothetical protein
VVVVEHTFRPQVLVEMAGATAAGTSAGLLVVVYLAHGKTFLQALAAWGDWVVFDRMDWIWKT